MFFSISLANQLYFWVVQFMSVLLVISVGSMAYSWVLQCITGLSGKYIFFIIGFFGSSLGSPVYHCISRYIVSFSTDFFVSPVHNWVIGYIIWFPGISLGSTVSQCTTSYIVGHCSCHIIGFCYIMLGSTVYH